MEADITQFQIAEDRDTSEQIVLYKGEHVGTMTIDSFHVNGAGEWVPNWNVYRVADGADTVHINMTINHMLLWLIEPVLVPQPAQEIRHIRSELDTAIDEFYGSLGEVQENG